MKFNKTMISKLFLLILGVSSLLLAYQDWTTGIGTRRGLDVTQEGNPSLFKAEVYEKVVFGVFLIGMALFVKPKDKD